MITEISMTRFIIKLVIWNKSSLLAEDYFPKQTNIKLKQKLCSKVIRKPSEEKWI